MVMSVEDIPTAGVHKGNAKIGLAENKESEMPSTNQTFDLIVIGSGIGGLSVASLIVIYDSPFADEDAISMQYWSTVKRR